MSENWCLSNSLEGNVDKCAVIHFGCHNPRFSYYLSDIQMSVVAQYKDLGIIVDDHLSFQNHISLVTKKAFALSRIINKAFSYKSPALLSKLFKLYVSPIIFYGLPFFHPTSSSALCKLENIQRKFTRALYLKSSIRPDYATRLAIFNLCPLELLFLKFALLFLYKSLHSASPIRSLLPPFFVSCTRGASVRFRLPTLKSELRKSVFPHYVISIWNSLPLDVTSASTLALFRRRLNAVDFSPFMKGRT